MQDFMFWTAVIILTILCAGDPDLLDALVQYVQSLSSK